MLHFYSLSSELQQRQISKTHMQLYTTYHIIYVHRTFNIVDNTGKQTKGTIIPKMYKQLENVLLN